MLSGPLPLAALTRCRNSSRWATKKRRSAPTERTVVGKPVGAAGPTRVGGAGLRGTVVQAATNSAASRHTSRALRAPGAALVVTVSPIVIVRVPARLALTG